jgi:hypothetical protein
MPEFNSWAERLQWTSTIAENAKHLMSDEDMEWLAKQKTAMQNDSAMRAANQGNQDAGQYLLQKYGWMGRYFGVGVPKTDKFDF